MKTFTPLLKYLGAFLLLYFVLYALFSFSPIARTSANIYRVTTQPILQTFFSQAYLKLEPDNAIKSDPYLIRLVYAGNEEIRQQTELAKKTGAKSINMKATECDLFFNLFFTTFFVFLVALILITPIGLKDKLWAILSGTLLFYLFTVFKLSIFLLDLFNKSTFQMYKFGEFGTSFFEGFTNLLTSLGFSSFVVILIWGVAAFRKSNWKNFLDRFGERKIS
ncbi:MAG: hypothetical protein NXI23_12555 [Bacteroidetes bacterium]|jgi:hypothetical protein|nr:hypothetical protein [Bacteroidota bacterium]